MSSGDLECVSVDPAGEATRSVIWLHGLGADGHDFEPIVPYLDLPGDLGVRFVFPHAPKRAVTINMGLIMRAWYDIRGADLDQETDDAGVADSAAKVRRLIDREIERGVPAERIVLAGFSQGGAIALWVALRYPLPLAGVAALSCYLLGRELLQTEGSEANRGIPIFQAHGDEDQMVPMERGVAARDQLLELGYAVEWRSYRMGHEVHPQEIKDLGAWLGRTLGA